MITLLHLSDIHFQPRDEQSQLDIDQQIRRALVEDLASMPAGRANYDGLLLTGDIAFSGKKKEYDAAQKWLDDLFRQTGVSASSTYMVPGNHDVDRAYVEPELPLWASHTRVRENPDPAFWRDVISKQLLQDPLHSLLAPLKGYNDFAQGYDCRTEPTKLAWCRTFPKPLGGDIEVRLHGLNSALISDKGDEPGKLLVSEFQTSHFERTSRTVDIVLCHHPPEWLMDKSHLRNVVNSFAQLALFGHEHDTRIQPTPKNLQLFAGAVQPSRRDPADWLPTYHIVQLIKDGTGTESHLVIRIHTREFDKQNYKFRARRNENDEPVEEHRLKLPPWGPLQSHAIEAKEVPVIHTHNESQQPLEASMSAKMETAKRELIVHFFRLKTPDRYSAANAAGLLRDGDDSLQPQTMWAEVFKRATEEANGLARFWDAVACRDSEIKDSPNPFNE